MFHWFSIARITSLCARTHICEETLCLGHVSLGVNVSLQSYREQELYNKLEEINLHKEP